MRAWYDIREPNLPGEADEDGIRHSEATLRRFIDQEVDAGIDTERIVLAGFSQGGVIGLRTGLLFERPLAGILALSTYLPLPDATRDEAHPANQSTSIFMAHGRQDPLIPIEAAKDSSNFLSALGYPLQWFEYNMPHTRSAPKRSKISRAGCQASFPERRGPLPPRWGRPAGRPAPGRLGR